MKKVELDVLGEDVNAWVVQVPGRAFPGVVVQGDSLRILLNRIAELREATLTDDRDEADGLLEEIEQVVGSWIHSYDAAVRDVKA
jgi:hypothetical protein